MKKRRVVAAVLAAACACPAHAFAAVGDVAGSYYSTDIVTYVNGTEISSINIGGQTLISAEDMEYHGFSVNWLGGVRRLEITDNPSAQSGTPPAVERPTLPPGSLLGYYYVTDIVTLLNGQAITSYNIGGRTYIWAEQMREFDYQVDWDGGARTLSIKKASSVGDVAGTYYSTDIVTYVNGTEISSINIGGQTLISAEDMIYHGFDVTWRGDTRRLEVVDNPNAQHGTPPAVERPNFPVGTALGYYYITDIVTTLNGREITAYNIGGRTYLWAEEMRDFGYQVDWNGQARTLSVGKGGQIANTHTVTFYLNDGSSTVYTTSTVSSGNSVIAPAAPTRNGYTFGGWYTDSETQTQYGFSSPVSSDLSLYAKWTGGDGPEVSYTSPSAENIVADPEDNTVYYVNNQLLLTAADGVSRETIEQLVQGCSGEIVGYIEITGDYQIQLPEALTKNQIEQIVEELRANASVEEASIHYLYEMEYDAIPNDEKWKNEEWSSDYPEGINWGVEAIHAMEAWDYADEMNEVKVGIIDTMFDTSHEDLVYAEVWNNPQSISNQMDYANRSHGTHVSGTMAACYNNGTGTAGVAPKVKLYGYSILGTDTDSNLTDPNRNLAGMMEWKYALAKLLTSGCRVINVSMSNRSNLALQSTVLGNYLNKLIDKGYDFVIVQAAGNHRHWETGHPSSEATVSGLFTGITIPAVKDRIIIVGAIGNNESHQDDLFHWFGNRVFDGYYYADFSNFGERVDIAAPGVKIYSTVPGSRYEDSFTDRNQRWNWDGTSMAAPHVAGTAAMCFAINPALTGVQVKDIVVRSSTNSVTDTNYGHPVRTYPILNAEAAVELAKDTTGTAPSPVNPSTGIVMGNVRGYNEDHQAVELRDVSVTAYRISDGDGNLQGYSASTRSDENGNYELILEAGQYYINLFQTGYLPFVICNVSVEHDQVLYQPDAILIRDSGATASNIMGGTVRNALTGAEIEGVTVSLRLGWNHRLGALATTVSGEDAVTVTDSSGSYRLEMIEGCYTAELKKDGYITGYANVVCTVSGSQSQDSVLTPELPEDEYRIVLTWSETPRDLDSHIRGPLSTGGTFHVCYFDKVEMDQGVLAANLDIDDTSSYGPETVTLKKTQDGVYKYAVHDFTNRSSSNSKQLSMSGAKVELYGGNSLLATFTVPINMEGTLWNVFEIEGTEIRTINTLSFVRDPRNVLAEPESENPSEDGIESVGPGPIDIEKNYEN